MCNAAAAEAVLLFAPPPHAARGGGGHARANASAPCSLPAAHLHAALLQSALPRLRSGGRACWGGGGCDLGGGRAPHLCGAARGGGGRGVGRGRKGAAAEGGGDRGGRRSAAGRWAREVEDARRDTVGVRGGGGLEALEAEGAEKR